MPTFSIHQRHFLIAWSGGVLPFGVGLEAALRRAPAAPACCRRPARTTSCGRPAPRTAPSARPVGAHRSSRTRPRCGPSRRGSESGRPPSGVRCSDRRSTRRRGSRRCRSCARPRTRSRRRSTSSRRGRTPAAAKPTQTRRRMRRCERSQSSAVRRSGSSAPGWLCGDRCFFMCACAWPADGAAGRRWTIVVPPGASCRPAGMRTFPAWTRDRGGRRRRTERAEIRRAAGTTARSHGVFALTSAHSETRAGWQAQRVLIRTSGRPMSVLTEEQARAYMHKLLGAMSQAGGSDLFISSDFPPSMKSHGSMQPLTQQKLTRRRHPDARQRDDERAPARGVRAGDGVQLRDHDPGRLALSRQRLRAAAMRRHGDPDDRDRDPELREAQAARRPEGRHHEQARAGARRRRDRLGQVDVARRDDRSPQPHLGRPHHHGRGPGRVRPPRRRSR